MPRVYLFDFLILISTILPFHFFHLLLIVDFLDDLQKLLPFLLVDPGEVPFFDSFLNEPLDLLLLLHGHLPLFFFFVNVVGPDLEVGLVLVLLFFLLHFYHAFVLLHSLSSLSFFFVAEVLILALVLLDGFGVDCLEHGVSFAHCLLTLLYFSLLVSIVVALF